MEKVFARFLVPTAELRDAKANIIAGGKMLTYTELDSEVEKFVREQMSGFWLHLSCFYEYEYDDDDDGPSRSYDTKIIELADLVSLSSPTYSTDAPCADIIVENGTFSGVVLKGRRWGGSGWDNYDESWYVILYADGRIIGKNETCYCFSGESSSKCEEKTFTLEKKEEK